MGPGIPLGRDAVNASLHVILLALLSSGIFCALALLAFWQVARRSVSAAALMVPVVAVTTFAVGLVATSRAMFLSSHDLGVALLVCAAAGVLSLIIGIALSRKLRQLQLETAEAAAAHEAERRIEANRRDLVAMVSHDLRTPLAGLRAMAEALEDGVVEEPVRYHRAMRLAVERLSGMVDDLFDLARIQAGALQLHLSEVSTADLISDALAAADPVAKANGIELRGTAPAVGSVYGDEGELHRALANLIRNAIRHTPLDGVVVLSAEQLNDRVIFAVTDQCGGIPDADLPHVFDVAWRGSNARTPGDEVGAGLGLAIVRGIAEAHGGSVRVDNVANGCRFELVLNQAAA